MPLQNTAFTPAVGFRDASAYPNPASSTEVRDQFQDGLDQLRDEVNTKLIAVLNSITAGSSGAENIGSATITGITGNTVHDQIANVFLQLVNIVLDQVPDGSITDAKLSSTEGQIKDKVDSHISDLVYQVAGGTSTALTLTTATLTDGYSKTFIANENNSGSATTINTKPLYKPGGTDAPTLIAGKAYTIWYNTTGDCFFIKASAEGTATQNEVLAGYTFTNTEDTFVGTLYKLNEGDTLMLAASTERFTAETTPQKKKEMLINTTGKYRVVFTISTSNTSYAAYGQIYKNGVAYGTLRSTNVGSGGTIFTEDLVFTATDTCELWIYAQSGGTAYGRYLQLRISEMPIVVTD